MAGKFKYIKKMIVTISKGPRKGQKELRYFYKGDKVPGGAGKVIGRAGSKFVGPIPQKMLKAERTHADVLYNRFARQAWKESKGKFHGKASILGIFTKLGTKPQPYSPKLKRMFAEFMNYGK